MKNLILKIWEYYKMANIYIPEWHVKQFLNYLRGHLVEGDMTHKQMILAIDNYIKDVDEEEAVEVNEN